MYITIEDSESLGWMVSQSWCFFCDEGLDINKGVVLWMGNNGEQIILHRECAVKLGEQLIKESGRIEGKLNLHPGMWEKTPKQIKEEEPEMRNSKYTIEICKCCRNEHDNQNGYILRDKETKLPAYHIDLSLGSLDTFIIHLPIDGQ